MSAVELTIWSMSLGAIAAVMLARASDLAVRPSLSQLMGVAYHGIVFVFVLLMSGVLAAWFEGLDSTTLHMAQVLVGPVILGLSNFWVRGWLGARRRDRLMSLTLQGTGLALPLAGLVCLQLPLEHQLPAAAALALLGSTVALWLTVRAWLMGDRLAPVMAVASLLSIPAVAGLYALALQLPGLDLPLQAVAAACAALGNGLIGMVLWRRHRHDWRARTQEADTSNFDPVTRLYSGVSLVRKLIKAQRRRTRTRRDGAILALLVFDIDRVATQVGTVGVNELFIALSGRMQRQVGVVNPVGRYCENCFVSLVETIESPGWLRTLGLRLATSLRQPVEVRGLDGQRVSLRPDIGVGLVHLAHGSPAVEDILHDAQRMAQAARGMRSRTAMLDPATGQLVPVEHAALGPRRHRHALHHAHGAGPRPLRG